MHNPGWIQGSRYKSVAKPGVSANPTELNPEVFTNYLLEKSILNIQYFYYRLNLKSLFPGIVFSSFFFWVKSSFDISLPF
jgi:hypothetical protein